MASAYRRLYLEFMTTMVGSMGTGQQADGHGTVSAAESSYLDPMRVRHEAERTTWAGKGF